jgi:spectinomycin phosphotransferase
MPDFTVILYPFINGVSGKKADLSDDQLIELGKTLRIIHDNFKQSYTEYTIPVEQFSDLSAIPWIVRLQEIMCGLNSVPHTNEYVRQFIEMYKNRKEIIMEMLLRAGKYVKLINKSEITYCLCHADLHAANIFISDDDFYIVDWDTMIMAPKERDLMFIGAGVAEKWNTERETELFYRGYGDYDKVNHIILDYYRYIRIIEDLVVYYDQFFEKNIEEKNQKSIVEIVGSIFWPNGVADMAFKNDNNTFYFPLFNSV